MHELEKVFPEMFVFWYDHSDTNKKKAMFECDVQFRIYNTSFEIVQDAYAPRIRPISIFNSCD